MTSSTVIGVSYVVIPSISSISQPVRTNLGTIKIEWSPEPMPLSPDITLWGTHSNGRVHGALDVVGGEVKFNNPQVIIEEAPFDVGVDIEDSCRVSKIASERSGI